MENSRKAMKRDKQTIASIYGRHGKVGEFSELSDQVTIAENNGRFPF